MSVGPEYVFSVSINWRKMWSLPCFVLDVNFTVDGSSRVTLQNHYLRRAEKALYKLLVYARHDYYTWLSVACFTYYFGLNFRVRKNEGHRFSGFLPPKRLIRGIWHAI